MIWLILKVISHLMLKKAHFITRSWCIFSSKFTDLGKKWKFLCQKSCFFSIKSSHLPQNKLIQPLWITCIKFKLSLKKHDKNLKKSHKESPVKKSHKCFKWQVRKSAYLTPSHLTTFTKNYWKTLRFVQNDESIRVVANTHCEHQRGIHIAWKINVLFLNFHSNNFFILV